jgi:hypothetical protein
MKRGTDEGKSLATRASEAKRRKRGPNIEAAQETKEDEEFATVALDGDVEDLSEVCFFPFFYFSDEGLMHSWDN